MTILKLDAIVDSHKCITPDEGEKAYNIIKTNIQNGNEITIDFADLDIITTAYLNVAIGRLYKDYTSEKLNELIKFDNLDQDNVRRIRQVVETAKLFYADQESFIETLNV